MKPFFLQTIWFVSLLNIIFLDPISAQLKFNNDPSILKDPTGYKIRAGDKIRISVRGESETNVEALIDRDGKVRAAYLSELKVSGSSTKQVEVLITNEYKRNLIYENPIVSVYVLKYSDRVVFLSGSVNRKGPYVLPPEVEAMNVVEVIARAGGFTDIARKDKIFITG